MCIENLVVYTNELTSLKKRVQGYLASVVLSTCTPLF